MVINNTRKLFGLHKNGFLFPITITVKQVSGGLSNTVFIGIISAITYTEKEYAAIIDTNSGQILRYVFHMFSHILYILILLSILIHIFKYYRMLLYMLICL